MKEIAIAGILRGREYSPNHVGNDAAIFRLAAAELRRMGWTVNEYTEEYLSENDIREPYIFNMVRSSESIRRLQKYEKRGKVVINSAFGIENCTREKMTRLLLSNHIPHPRSLIISTGKALPFLKAYNIHDCWIKRGNFHAIRSEDVAYVHNYDEAVYILRDYADRGIANAVINEHLPGDLVKFYGIAGTDFFYWFYPSVETHSKFGNERINGTAKGIPFDEAYLRAICTQAAGVLNVQIYGGDCIVSEEGIIRIIDFNDWPSFAPCRNEAAPFIARRIDSLITKVEYAAV
jgi:hypothetical protein